MSACKFGFYLTIKTFTLMAIAASAFGQAAVLPSVRIDTPGVNQRAEADAEAMAMDYSSFDFVFSDPPNIINANSTYAVAAQGATAGAGNVTCTGMALSSAICITPVGGTTFIPKADCTLNLLATALGADFGYGFGHAHASGACFAQGTFRVASNRLAPNVTSGTLVSELYLVATGDDMDAASLGFTVLNAQAAASSVDAMGDSSGFAVMGSLATVNGPPQGFFSFLPGLNDLWVGSQRTSIGNQHRVSSAIVAQESGVNAFTDGVSMWGFSAAGSYAIFP